MQYVTKLSRLAIINNISSVVPEYVVFNLVSARIFSNCIHIHYGQFSSTARRIVYISNLLYATLVTAVLHILFIFFFYWLQNVLFKVRVSSVEL